MSDSFSVKSRIRDYKVSFTDDFARSIKNDAKDCDFLFLDKKIDELYGDRVKNFFPKDHIMVIGATEHNKTLENSYKLIKSLVEKNVRKNSTLFAIGGGVIEDLVGFVSSVIFRGVEWAFYPTTLLAQADSCIGSKTSINMDEYKNLLGSFYPPSRVIIDTAFLNTLTPEEIKSGIGEMLHFYLIAGKNKLATGLMNDYEKFLKEPKGLKKYILSSLQIKKKVIEFDELDKGERNIFNYGHTFGHAIETATSYAINHGQAVAMGMDIANHLSFRLGHINKEVFEYMRAILHKNIPDFKLAKENIDIYFKALSKDKKNIGSSLGCILTRGPGSMIKAQIPMDDEFKDIIKEYFKLA